MDDEVWGLVEVGVFQDGGNDAAGFTMKLAGADAARLVLAQLADSVWFEAQLLELCTRCMERVEAVGLPDSLTGDVPWTNVGDAGNVDAARGRETVTPSRPRTH